MNSIKDFFKPEYTLCYKKNTTSSWKCLSGYQDIKDTEYMATTDIQTMVFPFYKFVHPTIQKYYIKYQLIPPVSINKTLTPHLDKWFVIGQDKSKD